MKFGSVCSGIEAASVAWESLGWKAAWFSEIEPFPCAVLKHHYPEVPNHGDMTTLPDRILSGEVEAPDVFCGGTPCQAFSVAGNRKSLDDARGNLSLTFCEIANAIDSVRYVRGERPAVIFWENVLGCLSTKDNFFGCFLGKLAGSGCELQPPRGGWANAGCVHGPDRSIAWRVLDARYFGLAATRRRVFVCAFKPGACTKSPSEILFEQKGGSRDCAPLPKRFIRGLRKDLLGCMDTRAINAFDRADLDKLIFDYEKNTVRRPTVLEAERVMGFRDGYTDIPYKGKPEAPDGPRYKALGNSWAVPVVTWIGQRIKDAL